MHIFKYIKNKEIVNLLKTIRIIKLICILFYAYGDYKHIGYKNTVLTTTIF